MVRIPPPRFATAAACLLFTAAASAQTPPPAPSALAPPPKPSAEKPAPAPRPASKAPQKKTTARRKKADKPAPILTGAVATSPSFRMLDEGKSRVFLEVSQKVEVTEQKARGRVIYKLKGASVPLRNSRLPLPTGYFATPVGQIELVDEGDGAALIIELREAAEPTHRVIETPRGIALQVDFPSVSTDHPPPPRLPGSGKQLSSAPDPE